MKDLPMARRMLTVCCATVVTLMLSCRGGAFADDTPSAVPEAKAAAQSHGRGAARSRRLAHPAKAADKKAAESKVQPKAQPWAAVDPDRAVIPPAPGEPATAAKPAVPTAKWAKDSFDFGTKVTGSNDFHLLPRFDINDNPQGLGGEAGINLHF